MSEFFFAWGLFLAKGLSVVVLVGLLAVVLMRAARRDPGHVTSGRLHVERLGDRLRRIRLAVQQQMLTRKEWKALIKAEEAAAKAKDNAEHGLPKLYVLDFVGDIRASQVDALRHEVSAIVQAAKPGDEVMVRLDSPGGMVHTYGLAASQLARIKAAKLPLTICVDKVAASGGYMMAAVADRIVAAPFAVLGSIGVVAQLPNLNKVLKKLDVDYEIITAGKWKRTLTVLGENTDEAREQFRKEIDHTHGLFQDFLAQHRPQLPLAEVADGRTWYGTDAVGLGLCDEIRTSDDWLLERIEKFELLRLQWMVKRGVGERFGSLVSTALGRVVDKAVERDLRQRSGM